MVGGTCSIRLVGAKIIVRKETVQVKTKTKTVLLYTTAIVLIYFGYVIDDLGTRLAELECK